MIKINLVPLGEKKKRKELFIIVCAVSAFLVLILLMAYIYGKRLGVEHDLNNQIEEVKKESEGYQDKIKEINDLKMKEDNLASLKKTITSISETQRKVTVAIDQLAINLPDGVWFTSITQGKGTDSNKFILLGYAFSGDDLKNYYNNLQRPGGFFKNPTLDLKNVTAAVGNNQQITQFQLTVTVSDLGT